MQMTQTTLVHGIYGITYALGEYDPGSAQDGRTSSEIRSLASNLASFVRVGKEFSWLNILNIILFWIKR